MLRFFGKGVALVFAKIGSRFRRFRFLDRARRCRRLSCMCGLCDGYGAATPVFDVRNIRLWDTYYRGAIYLYFFNPELRHL